MPNSTVIMYEPPQMVYHEREQALVDLDVEARIAKIFYVGGSVGIPVWKTGSGFFPMELQSIFRAGFRPAPGIEIGWSHLCTHPVMPYQPIFGQQALWEGFYDEFHVKLSGEVKLW